MRIPLAVNIESRNGLPFSDSYILNGYVQSESGVAKVMKRPGLASFHQFTAGVGQGAFDIAGTPYVIIGDTICLCQAPWTTYAIPSVTSANLPYDTVAQPSYIATPYAVIKSTAGMWTFDGTTITKVVSANYPATTVRGMAYLDGAYYVKTPAGQIFGSAIGDATIWTALNYITSSDLPGLAVALSKHLNYIVSLSENSTTFYYDANNPVPGSPLGYAQILTQAIGCASAGSIATVGDSLLFMSQTTKGRSVSILDGQSLAPTRVSTPAIDGVLNLDNLANVTSFSLAISGRFFYCLTLPTTGITFAYNLTENHWTYWASGTTSVPVSVTLTLGADLTTVSGVMSSGSLLPGQSVAITGASNPIFNGTFTTLTASGVNFTFQVAYGGYLVDQSGNFLVTNVGEFLTATQIPLAGRVAGATQVAVYGTTYFSSMASTVSGLLLDKASGLVSQISPTTYADAGGAIDFNIVTGNISSEQSVLARVGAAEVHGDREPTTAYLRYSDTDYQSWSMYRPLNMSLNRARVTRLGASRKRAFHFRHVEAQPMRVTELTLGVA